MARPDREMLFQTMAKLMEQQNIVVSKPGQLFTEIMDFHSCLSSAIISIDDRVSIPRSRQWERPQFPVDLGQLEGIPVVTSLQRYYQNPRNWSGVIGGHIGDQTCTNNAKSVHFRCAVNPCGPCEGCPDYHPGVGGAGGAL